jgi:ABC-2 type transport system ATP-binding protein
VSRSVIELVDLTKTYGTFTAVDRLNLSIDKGEVFGLLGPNGAGKSTTILMMLGLTEPTGGKVTVCGIDSTRNPIEVKRRVGYLPEDVGFYDDRNAFENLMYTARLNQIPDSVAKPRALDLLERVGLTESWKKKTGKFSRGMRQRLGLADVLIKEPEVIILDEPTSGIDPQGVREFLELINLLRKEKGLTVLFSSHNLHQVQQVCDRVGIFVSGKLQAEGDIENLSKRLFTHSGSIIEVGLNLTHEQIGASYPSVKSFLKEVVFRR